MGRGKSQKPTISHSKANKNNSFDSEEKYVPPSKRTKNISTNNFISKNLYKKSWNLKPEIKAPNINQDDLFPSLTSSTSNKTIKNECSQIDYSSIIKKKEKKKEKTFNKSKNKVAPGWCLYYQNDLGKLVFEKGPLTVKEISKDVPTKEGWDWDRFKDYLEKLEDDEDERFELFGDIDFYKNPWDEEPYYSEDISDSDSESDNEFEKNCEYYAEDPP